jgi:hypothetical protein
MRYSVPEVSCYTEENGDAAAGRARWSRRTAFPLQSEPFDGERSTGAAGGSSGQRRSGKGWRGSCSRRGTAGGGAWPLLLSWRHRLSATRAAAAGRRGRKTSSGARAQVRPAGDASCRCSGYRGISAHLLLGPVIGPSSAQGRINDPSYGEDPHKEAPREENDDQNC